jgi:hypothetical protein
MVPRNWLAVKKDKNSDFVQLQKPQARDKVSHDHGKGIPKPIP